MNISNPQAQLYQYLQLQGQEQRALNLSEAIKVTQQWKEQAQFMQQQQQ